MSILAKNTAEFIKCFEEIDLEIEDIRNDEQLLYPIKEVVLLTVSAVLACAEGWREISDYGVKKLKFLRKYLPFEYGIPTKTTLCRIFSIINRNKFEAWFMKWAHKLADIIPGDLINIDGKTIKGSRSGEEKATHVLNVFAKKHGIVVAQRTVDDKSNEIPELPKLIDDLDIEGATVTIDAIGGQKAIASKIIEKKANYYIGLKENQPKLYDAARYLFSEKDKPNAKEYFDYYSERDYGHGRKEWRKCWVTTIPEWMEKEYSDWAGLKSICLIESERHIGEQSSIEQKLYISSEKIDAKTGLNNSRQHWLIENQLHYVLDVTFGEDDCKVHNAAENMSIVRKIVFNLIKKFKASSNSKSSIPAIRKKAAWDNNVTGEILDNLFT